MGSVLQTSSHFIIERLNETFKRGFSRFPTNLSRFEDSARITRKDTNRKFGFKVKRSPIFFQNERFHGNVYQVKNDQKIIF